jgi:hypothetical protein
MSTSSKRVSSNYRIAAAIGYARDHIAEVLTVERLAESAGMSLRNLPAPSGRRLAPHRRVWWNGSAPISREAA